MEWLPVASPDKLTCMQKTPGQDNLEKLYVTYCKSQFHPGEAPLEHIFLFFIPHLLLCKFLNYFISRKNMGFKTLFKMGQRDSIACLGCSWLTQVQFLISHIVTQAQLEMSPECKPRNKVLNVVGSGSNPPRMNNMWK